MTYPFRSRAYGPYAPYVLDRLYREQTALEYRRVDTLTAMRVANLSHDDDAWDRAGEEHDRLSSEIGEIKGLIWEIRETGGRNG